MESLILPLLLFVGMYFLLIRPQQRKMKEAQALIARAAAGDRVVLSSGIYGTITETLDTSAYVEIAQGIEVLVSRQAIQDIVDEFPTDDGLDDDDEMQDSFDEDQDHDEEEAEA